MSEGIENEKPAKKAKPEVKEEAPQVDIKGFLVKATEDIRLRERFEAVARQYGRRVTMNAGKLVHDIPGDQLPYMIALVK